MENLTIKQLLEMGASVDVDFLNSASKKEAEDILVTLGIEDESVYYDYEGENGSHEGFRFEGGGITVHSTFRHKFKEGE